TRSPRTAFDAQLSVERGAAKMRGLSHAHRAPSAPSANAQCPIHTRLHAASTRTGNTVLRVHTLHGLACRFHASSLMRNVRALRWSQRMAAVYPAGSAAR